MATLKEVQLKIVGVKKTKQITSAMKMVATSRLRGAQMGMEAFRPYAGKFAEVLGSLAEKAGEETSPLLTPREEVKKANIVLCTSDRGLCGGFNMSLINKAGKLAQKLVGDNVEVTFTNFGKRGKNWAKNQKYKIESANDGVVGGKFDFSTASTSGKQLIDGFLSGEYDEVYLIYSEYVGPAKQVPVETMLLPIPPIEKEEDEEQDNRENTPFLAEHICEPSPGLLLNEMLPKNVYIQLYRALLETTTSNFAAQMLAMENATNACNDMVSELQTLYNKARQAGITSDLMDIVGGAEALNG